MGARCCSRVSLCWWPAHFQFSVRRWERWRSGGRPRVWRVPAGGAEGRHYRLLRRPHRLRARRGGPQRRLPRPTPAHRSHRRHQALEQVGPARPSPEEARFGVSVRASG